MLRGVGRRVRDALRRVCWSPPPRASAPLRAIAAAAGGTVAVRKEAREQRYPLPEATDEVRDFFRAVEAMAMPEEVRCTVPGGRVVGPGVVLSPDGHTLARDVSLVFGRMDDDHPMLHVDRIPPPRRLRGRTLSVASVGGDSYYHWLIDELPRFLEAAGEGHDAVIGHRGHLARAAQVRRLVHEEEIWAQLESRGFERLHLERMAWEEQIAAFAAAEIVVAPHGAGLANLVFCKPGTRVIELFDRRYLHWCYWKLAAACGLEYRAIVNEGAGPPVHDFAHMGSDIDIRWPSLAAGL